ncbi:hypothetical protein EYR40_005696 [Pleurotus pulmonarius]|nr:hypothetical protein EYR40_005696 [Pleurotus pulmonarius]
MSGSAEYDPWSPYVNAPTRTSYVPPTQYLPNRAQFPRQPHDSIDYRRQDDDVYPNPHRRTVSDASSSDESLTTTPRIPSQQTAYVALLPHTHDKPPTAFPPPPPSRSGRQNLFARSFEAPDWRLLVLHTVLCLLAFPTLLVFTIIARNRTLFWTRFIVSIGCGLVGFFLAISLINMGKAFLEAATWATLIHQSQLDEASGIKLKDFAALSDDPTSAWSALRILWDRTMYTGTARSKRKRYDSRIWTLFIVFFLFLITAAAALPFILGRIVDITTRVEHQHLAYTEVSVKGDLTDNDITQAAALQPAFNNFNLTWTLSGFATEDNTASAVSFPWEADNDNVYFAEVTRSQLRPNGHGLGTFDTSHTRDESHTSPTEIGTADASKPVDPGQVLRFPRWGIRMHCRRIPNPTQNIIPASTLGRSYVFTPRDTLRDLFSSFKLDLPDRLNNSVNLTDVLKGDSLPASINTANTALGAVFFDNGISHSFKSDPVSMGQDGKGFTSLEVLLVRVDTSFTPKGVYPVTRTATTPPQTIGYDGAICLELFEPWVLETYNSTVGAPTSTRIVSKGNEIANVGAELNTGARLSGVKRQLDSSNLSSVYDVAHGNSVNQLLKDNGHGSPYAPNPTVISYTNGQGPEGYTELSESFFADSRARADATHILAYLAGNGDTVARSYPDLVLSSASLNYMYMGIFVGATLVLGLAAGLFVPKLPLGIPKRGFEVYSWIAAFYGDDIAKEIKQAGVDKHMELSELEKRLGHLKFHFAA